MTRPDNYGLAARPASWCRKEAAHVLLHGEPPGMYLPRALKEVEAESVAFVVASAHGMATDDYSFPYVATWAGGKDPARAVAATQARVAQASRTIIDASAAAHTDGGRPPGAEAVARAVARRAATVDGAGLAGVEESRSVEL